MTFVSDATSLILLAKVGLLELFTNRNSMVVPQRVFDEVVKGKDKGRVDAFSVEKLRDENKLSITFPNEETKGKIQKLFNIKGGELDVLAISLETNATILTDDKKCLNAAKALKLEFITTLDVIVALSKRGTISREGALKCIDGLEEYGWYTKDLIKIYKEAVK
jgi:predicted nucleic acid-binding protein